MTISAAVLAPDVVSAVGSTDAIGIAAWTAITGVIATWLLTGVPTPTAGDPLFAVGVVVSGSGAINYADGGSTLGVLLAAAAGSIDPVGVAAWTRIGLALGAWMNANAQIDPSNLVAVVGGPNPNPLTGAGTVKFRSTALGDDLAAAASAADEAGQEKWRAIGDAIIEHMKSFGVVNVGAMVSPPAGGAVTGAGVLA